MKTIIRRTSNHHNEQPCDGAILEQVTYLDYRVFDDKPITLEWAKTQWWYNDWFNNGENHREENGTVVCDHKIKQDVWTIEFDNIFDLCQKYAPIIIEPSSYKEYEWQVEIYDSYRE